MRLTFNANNHLNADISDEEGITLYTISTPSASQSKKVTTITKYHQGDSRRVEDCISVPRKSDACKHHAGKAHVEHVRLISAITWCDIDGFWCHGLGTR